VVNERSSSEVLGKSVISNSESHQIVGRSDRFDGHGQQGLEKIGIMAKKLPSDARCLIRKAAIVLANGYILFFFSERVFWSFWRPGDTLSELLITF